MHSRSETDLRADRLALPPLAYASPPEIQARFNRGVEPALRQAAAEDLAAAFTGLAVSATLLLGGFAGALALQRLGAPLVAFLVSGGFGIAACVSLCVSVLQVLPGLFRLRR